ncbi:MAG: PQQ-binding-like beta-propeller repeat protein [Streptosporangiales bacterium]|nr:PQQ-binding-like beta-propeller repeat protein [Streptosporangiales bacterium]
MAGRRLIIVAAVAAGCLLTASDGHGTALRAAPPWRPANGFGLSALASLPAGVDARFFPDVVVSRTTGPLGISVVRATRIADGGTLWEHRRVTGAPADVVALGEDRVGVVWRDGPVFGIDVRSGLVAWRTDLPDLGELAARAGARDADDRYNLGFWEAGAAGGAMAPVLVVGYYARLQVIDGRDGALRWQAEACPGVGRVKAIPLTRGVSVDEGCGISTVRDPYDGRVLWTRPSVPTSDGQPDLRELGEDTVLVTEADGRLVARRVRDGRLRWRYRFSPGEGPLRTGPLAPAGSGVFLVSQESTVVEGRSSRQEPMVGAQRISDGRVVWRFNGRARGVGASAESPLTDGRVAYVLSEPARALYLLDARTGHELGRHRLPACTGGLWPGEIHRGVLSVYACGRLHLFG